ncbi:hypothetical protein SSPO_045540 [Streptomyces antimycoticus]|uniref:NADH-quinone oxidoreductase subunit K n=1 Tax=Streptomyces antimycoticus TaxID=68175 RepID=A0A499V045_9ACTN|nr:hypothetical protein SSPO_045540 [Streptomyces antimycoticus]
MHLAYPAVLAVLLFCTGLYGVLARRNAILMLMSVELMLNAVNLNLVAFDVWLRDTLHAGQALTLFTIAIAAAEIGIGLAIVLLVHRNRGTADVDKLRDLADPPSDGQGPMDDSMAAPLTTTPTRHDAPGGRPRDDHDRRRSRPPPALPRRRRRASAGPPRPRFRPPPRGAADPRRGRSRRACRRTAGRGSGWRYGPAHRRDPARRHRLGPH